jgi:ABC-type transport system involved in multi-copper enzyme maturation permease subunit
MGIAVLFFGTFNASREVVREKSIFLRERLVFLRTLPYLLSKFLFLAAINSVQCLIMTLFLKGFIGAEGHFVEYLITLLITGCSAIGLGLLISTIVRTAETAMAIVPIVIIINIVLAGFLKPLNSKNQEYVGLLASPVIARWSTEALMEVERRGLSTLVVNVQPSGCDYVGESPRAVDWCALRVQAAKGLEPKRLTVDFAVILGFNLIALALGYFRLRIGSRGD